MSSKLLTGMAACICAAAQQPAISARGVVNAASYSTTGNSAGGQGLAPGSIASIFGANLATATVSATTTPLRTTLAGTSVSVNGVAAPLFYVSPGQINFQVPLQPQQTPATPGVVVTTGAGSSDPYILDTADPAIGFFSLDSSGCGQGAVLNVHTDGTVSVNSPTDSISPGESLAAYGTGLGIGLYVGVPTPASPLTMGGYGAAAAFDLIMDNNPDVEWDGLAPGLIGADQFNVLVPQRVREGCAVPFQVAEVSITQPVTIAVRSGGGACVDPPAAGYGEIVWEKLLDSNATGQVTETETVTVSLQSSPGRQPPSQPVYEEGLSFNSTVYLGPSCPVPGYRSLAAGVVTAQGSGLSPATAVTLPLQGGPISGLNKYQASLPAGSIQAGTYTVAAAGGSDVAAFQSSVQIGADIAIQTPLAGIAFPCDAPVVINWTGGDANAWVAVTKVSHFGPYDIYTTSYARVSDGTISIPPPLNEPSPCGGGALVPIDLVIQEVPDPSEVTALSAQGLSLGGQHLWRLTHRFPASQD